MTARGKVREVFDITDRGLVVVVQLSDGRVHIGDRVRCAGQVGTVAGVEMISRRDMQKHAEDVGFLISLPRPKEAYLEQDILFVGGADDP